MFKSLHQLAGQCPAIIITVARDGADNLRVNVMPKAPTGNDGKINAKDGALFTPISVVGTPEELDAGFGDALKNYSEKRRDLQTAVDEAGKTMTAAKAAKTPPKPSPSRTGETKAPETPAAAAPAADAKKPATVVVKKYTPPVSSPTGQNFSSADLFRIDAAATEPEAGE